MYEKNDKQLHCYFDANNIPKNLCSVFLYRGIHVKYIPWIPSFSTNMISCILAQPLLKSA